MIYDIIGLLVLALALHTAVYALLLTIRARVKYPVVLYSYCYVIWTGASLFLYNSPDLQTALFWYRIASVGFLAVPAVSALIFVSLAEKSSNLQFKIISFVLGGITAVLYYKSFTGMFAITGFARGSFGLIEQLDCSSLWLYFFILYFLVSLISSFGYYYRSVAKKDNFLQKKHLRIIIIVSSFLVILFSAGMILVAKGNLSRIPFAEHFAGVIWVSVLWYYYLKYLKMLPSASILSNQVINIIDDMVIVVNKYNEIVLVNPAVTRFLEYESRDLIGKNVAGIFSEGFAVKIKHIHDLLNVLGPGSGKTQLIAKRGRTVDVSFTVTARSEIIGEVSWIILVFNDISKLLIKEAEDKINIEQLQKAYHDLELTQEASLNIMEDLDRKSKELELAIDELKQTQEKLLQTEKMVAIGKLAGGIAHEINNPMTVILGYAQSIVKRIKEGDPYFVQLKAIEREAIRSKKLIDDLLTFSRSSKAVFEKVSINTAIEGALSLSDVLSKEKNVVIERDFAKGLPDVLANKNQLQQVIINLCTNAVDAVSQVRDSGIINIKTGLDGEYVNIFIKDDGAGIPKSFHRKIFEPFFTTKEVGKGTGLGLSLCYEIIKKHGGEITVESEPGKGALFTIKLPVD